MRHEKAATGEVSLARLRRNLKFFFVYKALLGGFGFAFPALFDLYRECGMHNGEIAYLQAIFAIVLAGLGLGGGYFADRLTRRAALVSGLLFHVAGEVAYATGRSFGGLVFAEVLLAAALALMGGAEHAILFEWLLEARREREHPKMRSYGLLVSYLAIALTGVAGALIMRSSVRLPFYLSAGCTAAALLVALKFREPARAKMRGRVSHVREMYRIGHEAFGSAAIRWLLLFAGLMLAFTLGGFPLCQPYYAEQGLPRVFFGLIVGAQNALAALFVIASPRIERRVGQRVSLMLIVGASAGMYLLMGLVPSAYTTAAVLLAVWVRGFSDVVFADYLNRSIGSEHRATINSLMSFISRVVYAALLVPLGAIAQSSTVANAFAVLGGITALAGVLLLVFMPRGMNIGEQRPQPNAVHVKRAPAGNE